MRKIMVTITNVGGPFDLSKWDEEKFEEMIEEVLAEMLSMMMAAEESSVTVDITTEE